MPVLVAVALTLVCLQLGPDQLERYARVMVPLYVVCVALVLPLTARAIFSLGAAAALALLAVVNEVKIALTQTPLTSFDLQVVVANPGGLWTALGWPRWTMWALAALFVPVAAGVVALCGAWLWRAMKGWRRPRTVARFACCVVTAGSFLAFSASLGNVLAAGAMENHDLWTPMGLARYSRAVGTVPFLLFSHSIASKNSGVYYRNDPGASAPEHSELTESVLGYLTPVLSRPFDPPNIVVLFAESTFDPNRAFHLASPVESPLFTLQPDTELLGSLRVNVVGGGSWISEFESIVGVDSRLFGYAGYYTHGTLSPFVRRSFVTYLNEKGYDTAAYYSWSGDFYNVRNAYARYGFRHFFDADALGLLEWESVDHLTAAAALERTKLLQRSPFFSYVVLGENHSPHGCERFTDPDQLRTRFANTVMFEMDCQLNEYVRRLESTASAVEMWHRYLQDVETATGRPYVLMIFGDHQPHTFTSIGTPSFHDYTDQRTGTSLRETFVHIRSSVKGVIRCCDVDPPATMLPTLLSGYVASDAADVYLPVNLYLHAHCGSDMLGGNLSQGVRDFRGQPETAGVTDACRNALARGIAGLHASGVFSN